MTTADTPPSDPKPAPPTGGPDWLRWLGVACALLGWWISLDLLRISAGAAATNPVLASFCDPAADAGCASILRSGYAKVGRGAAGPQIPWAAVGAGYFALVAICFGLLDLRRTRFLPWGLALGVVLVFGGWASLDLVLVMARELREWCAGCVAAHALNGAILVIAAALYVGRWRRRGWGDAVPAVLPIAALLAGLLAFTLHLSTTQLFILAGNASELRQRYIELTSDPEYVALSIARQPRVEADLSQGAVFDGPADAPHEIVAFIDFQCPSCREFARVLDDVKREVPDRVRVAIRHFPQDSSCNPGYPHRGHVAACAAARAAEAVRHAAGDEAFTAYRRVLYDNQERLIGADFAALAAPLGIDAAEFAAALESEDVEQRLAADLDIAKRAGVTKLPAIFLNGRFVEHYRSKAAWLRLLGAEAPARE